MIASAFVGSGTATDTVLRRRRGCGSEKTPQPSVPMHMQYTAHYGAVDKMDQGLAAYKIPVSSDRWYFRLVTWSLDLIAWNMWRIAVFHVDQSTPGLYAQFAKHSGSDTAHRRFMLLLGNSLVCRAHTNAHAAVAAGDDNAAFFMCMRLKHHDAAWSHRSCDVPGCGGQCLPTQRPGPGEVAADGPRSAQIKHDHTSVAFAAQYSCAGCLYINGKADEAEAEAEAKAQAEAEGQDVDEPQLPQPKRARPTITRPRRGCAACGVHLCKKCIQLWDHATRTIPLPDGVSWADLSVTK